jgi:hypothetical protein
MDFNRIVYRADEVLNEFFKNKVVLDIASYDGVTSFDIANLGAKKVIGVEPRKTSVTKANASLEKLGYTNVKFVCGDATDYQLMETLLTDIDTVACFGVFYHLTDHFKFLKKICTSNCKYLLIETLFGLESSNPTMLCVVEPTVGNDDQSGINDGFAQVMVGAPNIVWIQQVLEIFNWQITYFTTDDLGDERMFIGAVNRNFIDVTFAAKLPQDAWQWDVEYGINVVGNKKFSIY